MKEEETSRRQIEAKERRKEVLNGVKGAAEDLEGAEENEDILNEEDIISEPEESSNPMSALLASARARAVEYDNAGEEDDLMDVNDPEDEGGVQLDTANASAGHSNVESSRRAYDKIFKSVLDTADIILYVLDARDPNATRSREIERQILAADGGSKRLVLILNKVDLVPPVTLQNWLKYLCRSFPTLPFRASTPAPNARTFDHKALTLKSTTETLFRALKTYAQGKNFKRGITVGVIGYPNVGKSSVVNALISRLGGISKRTVCPVGAEAGITTSLREVKLDNKLKIFDSPGIIFHNAEPATGFSKPMSQAQLTLLSLLPPKAISDPQGAVNLLLSRLSSSPAQMSSLLATYSIPPLMPSPEGDISTDFLIQVARQRGRLGKGGVPNLQSAAMAVLSDFRDGRIHGWVEAPSFNVEEGQKEIVEEWADEFKLEGLWADDEDTQQAQSVKA